MKTLLWIVVKMLIVCSVAALIVWSYIAIFAFVLWGVATADSGALFFPFIAIPVFVFVLILLARKMYQALLLLVAQSPEEDGAKE